MKQLSVAADVDIRTVRIHMQRKWLGDPIPKEELPPGIKGYRFKPSTAFKWIELYYPGKQLPQ